MPGNTAMAGFLKLDDLLQDNSYNFNAFVDSLHAQDQPLTPPPPETQPAVLPPAANSEQPSTFMSWAQGLDEQPISATVADLPQKSAVSQPPPSDFLQWTQTYDQQPAADLGRIGSWADAN